jgi:hypothetical protein
MMQAPLHAEPFRHLALSSKDTLTPHDHGSRPWLTTTVQELTSNTQSCFFGSVTQL